MYRDAAVATSLVGNTIVLTKTDGDWNPNVQVHYNPSGEPIDTGNENYAQEATIQLGTVYETWADDPLNLGLPVVGRASMVEGAPFWHPYYIANPLPLGQSQPDITDWSGGWPEVPVAV